VEFIDEHRVRFGVEPICRVLTKHGCKIAPFTYYAAKQRGPSRRRLREAELTQHITQVYHDPTKGRGVAGARKVWHLLLRDGLTVARCTVDRLMRVNGLVGVTGGRRFVTTTVPDPAAVRPPDLVHRVFRADRPNQLWIVDFTYVPTWSQMGFTAFVSDVYSRQIVGWRTAGRMLTDLPLDAPEMALWVRETAGENLDGLIYHSDAGSQYTAIRYADRLGDVGALASIGTVGDSYDCENESCRLAA